MVLLSTIRTTELSHSVHAVHFVGKVQVILISFCNRHDPIGTNSQSNMKSEVIIAIKLEKNHVKNRLT